MPQKTGTSISQSDIDAAIADVQKPIATKVDEALTDNGLPGDKKEFVMAQLRHETGKPDLDYNVSRANNNVSGITWNDDFPDEWKGTTRPPDEGGNYVHFPTYNDWAKEQIKLLKKDSGAGAPLDASTVEEYAHRLKKNGFYKASESEYANGMKGMMDKYGTPSISQADIDAAIADAQAQTNPQKKSPSESGLADNSQNGQTTYSPVPGANATDPITGLPVMQSPQSETKILPEPLPQTQAPTVISPQESVVSSPDWNAQTTGMLGMEAPKGISVGVNGKVDTPIIPQYAPSQKTADDVKSETANASDYLSKDIVNNISNLPPEYSQNLNSVEFNKPGNIIHDITDPHGDPKMTAGYMATRLAQMTRDHAAEKQSAMNAVRNEVHPDIDAVSKLDGDYFKDVSDFKNNATHLIDLQVANQAYKDNNFDAIKLGIERQKLMADPKATQDEINYNNGKPLDPNAKFAYQSIGLNILQKGKENTAANDQESAAEHFGEHSDNPAERLERDNPEVYQQERIKNIGNYIYKNDTNPVFHTIFSQESVSQDQLNDAAKALGYSKSQIKNIKPEDIPRSAGLLNESAQGFVNTAGAPLYEGGMRALASLGIANKDAVNARFHPGWEDEGGFGTAFTGNIPEAQRQATLDNPRGIVSAMAQGVGSLGGFLASGEAGAGLLKGSGLISDAEKANKLANFGTAALPSYNSAYERSAKIIGDSPEDEGKRQIYSIANGIIGGSVMMMDPKADVARDILGETKGGQSFTNMLKKTDIADMSAATFKDKITQAIHETGKHLGLQITMPAAQTVGENMTDMVFDPNGNHGIGDNVKQAATSGAISMFLPSLAAGLHAPINQSAMNKALLWEVGNNPRQYRNQITDLFNNGQMSREEFNQAHNNINKVFQIIGDQVPVANPINGTPLTTDQKQQYAWNLLQKSDLEKKLDRVTKTDDKAQIDLVNSQIKEKDADRAKILDEAGKSKTPEKPKYQPPVQEEPSVAPSVQGSVATDAQSAIQDYTTKIENEFKALSKIPGENTEHYQKTLGNLKTNPEETINEELAFYKQMLDPEPGQDLPNPTKRKEIQFHIDELQPIADKIAKEKNLGENKKEDISLTPEKKTTEDETKNNIPNGRQISAKESTESERVRSNANVQGQADDGRLQGQEENITPEETGEKEAGADTPPQPAISVSGKKKRKQIVVDEDPDLQTIDGGVSKGEPESKTEDALKEGMLNHPDQPVDALLTDNPTGETPADFTKRIGAAVERYSKPESEGGLKDNALLVTHSNVIKQLEAAYDPKTQSFDFEHPQHPEKVDKQSTEVGNLYEFKVKQPDGEVKIIHVARHGETEANEQDLQRDDNDKLTQIGKDDALDVATKLKEKGITPSEIISSDLPRTKETADIISKEFSKPQEPPKETPKPHGAIATEDVETENADASNRLKEIDEELLKQHASQKISGQKRAIAEKEKDIAEANRHNDNWYKKQDRIDRLEEEKADIAKKIEKEERQGEIRTSYKKAADSIRRLGDKIVKDDKLVGAFPAISSHLVKEFINSVADAVEKIGNLHIAIDSAIRDFKVKHPNEKFPTQDDAIEIADRLDYLKPKIKSEPVLPIDQEEYAKDILADIRKGNISYEEAVKEIKEEKILNREGKEVSDNVAINNKLKILNYIDWHNDHDLTSTKNSVTRIKRAEFGLREEIPAEHQSWDEALDKAKDKIDNEHYDPQTLVDELYKKPRAVNDEENAIILIHQQILENKINDIYKQINEAASDKDETKVKELKATSQILLDSIQKTYDVDKEIGTQTARGLAARRMMIDQRYKLIKMLAEYRSVANDGKPLSDEQEKQIQELHQKITDTQKAFDDYAKQKALDEEAKEKEIIDLQRQVIAGRQQKSQSGKIDRDNISPEEYAKQMDAQKLASQEKAIKNGNLLNKKTAGSRLRAWADEFEKKSKGNVYSSPIPITPKMIADAVRLVADGLDAGEEIFGKIKEVINNIKKDNPDINAKTLEMHLNKGILESGILEPSPEKRKVKDMSALFTNGKIDPKAKELKEKADREKLKYDEILKKEQFKQLPLWSKVQNVALRLHREFLLSSPQIAEKLLSAGVSRYATNAAEDVAGNIYSWILPKELTKGAIGEGGGLHVNETAKAIASGWTNLLKDWKDIKNYGKTDIDLIFGKYGKMPPEAINWMGSFHSMLKSPIKRYAFEKALTTRVRNTLENGGDPNNPITMSLIATGAMQDGYRAIFMQDNTIADAWNRALRALEKPDINGKTPYKSISTGLQWLMPFVKIGANKAAESGKYVYGAPVAAYKIFRSTFSEEGLKGLSSDEKDIILRNLKKGSIGIAAMVYAYSHPQNFGGFYVPGQKKKDEDADYMGLKIGDTKIPFYLLEAPIFAAMQTAATMRKVHDRYLHGQRKSVIDGVKAASLGLIQTNPYIDNPHRISELFESESKSDNWVDQQMVSAFIPSALSYAAKVTDPADEGNYVRKALLPENKRKAPKTLGEHFEGAIPRLREDLPRKHPIEEE